MSLLEALTLALVQAATEFLPVSSSGHLVLLQRWFDGAAAIDLRYDVLLHVATMLAVLVYFRSDVRTLLVGFFAGGRSGDGVFGGEERRAVGLLFLANIPTAVLGLTIEAFAMDWVTRPAVVGVMLLITGAILLLGRNAGPGRPMSAMTARDALLLGIAQGVAVLPGISRSGATITCGLVLGLDRELAARFSLLMSVPAILGAALLQWLDAPPLPAATVNLYATGMVAAGIAGYFAIDLILRLLRRRRFHWFAYYVWPLGVVAILHRLLT